VWYFNFDLGVIGEIEAPRRLKPVVSQGFALGPRLKIEAPHG
jgi:hypothetical protein